MGERLSRFDLTNIEERPTDVVEDVVDYTGFNLSEWVIENYKLPHDLIERLATLPLSRLNALLTGTVRKRLERATPSKLLERAGEKFTRPSELSPLLFHQFGALMLGKLPPTIESIELSPLAPLGTVAVLTKNDPAKVVLTPRGEVVADIPTLLALEAAKRRKKDPQSDTNLAAIGRLVRAQDFSKIPGFLQHFAAFGMVSQGRENGDYGFELQAAETHLVYYLSLLQDLGTFNQHTNSRLQANRLRVSFSDIRLTETLIEIFGVDRHELGRITQSMPEFSLFEHLGIDLPSRIGIENIDSVSEKILALQQELRNRLARQLEDSRKQKWPRDSWQQRLSNLSKIPQLFGLLRDELIVPSLQEKFPTVSFEFDLARLAGMGHYRNLCTHVNATNNSGEEFPLVDLGTPPWGQMLMSNDTKERMISSGFGLELFLLNFNS